MTLHVRRRGWIHVAPAEGGGEDQWGITCDPLEATPDMLTPAAKAQKAAGRVGCTP